MSYLSLISVLGLALGVVAMPNLSALLDRPLAIIGLGLIGLGLTVNAYRRERAEQAVPIEDERE